MTEQTILWITDVSITIVNKYCYTENFVAIIVNGILRMRGFTSKNNPRCRPALRYALLRWKWKLHLMIDKLALPCIT
jgi:hypothetical protein